MFVSLVKPASWGRLRLQSADPTEAPLIGNAFFTDPADLPRQIEGIREARRLARLPPLDDLVGVEVEPGEDVASDADLGRAVLAGLVSY